ncbi:DegT/DnrJ/EryC1/StrS family aminotransferase [Lachnospira pectinoschiza]|uniref:dTDP-4-amino-4,6-dideoxygalactose transaminase n=1 Tax=Lachnospira pectinoschiza TaxID=28052 RepID=A0A1G9T0I6_9FIRM|nr:DegT/DnrJ/EryC1/StrS family aminotransferase [Lachnospira pectinoschiza]SDM41224.1 dTDP-4-amino-4,6-dideoxygalactose transaminase [Lachnospira pectinoschiza]
MGERINITRSSMPPYEEFIDAIKPLWDSHWMTNMGRYHNELEEKLKDYLKVDKISLLVNGHMSLEMIIQAFSFPEGSEIITSPFTFISTTHAIVRNGCKPVFCDVKASDGTIDEEKIEDLITEKTVAILPIHVYGNLCATEKIEKIAKDYNLKVIYDAAHAFGESLNEVGIGNFGDASILSFHATKVFNSIEGGAVCFHDDWIYEKLYNLKNFGIRSETLVAEVGANAKMNEFCAIMGLCNLRHLAEAIKSRKEAFDYYCEALDKIKGISTFRVLKPGEVNNYAYFPILVTDEASCNRNEIYDKLRSDDIFARKYFYPITADQNCFRNKYKEVDLHVARDLSKHILTLPLYEGITRAEQDRVIKALS